MKNSFDDFIREIIGEVLGGTFSTKGGIGAGGLGSGARNRGKAGQYPIVGYADDGDEGPPVDKEITIGEATATTDQIPKGHLDHQLKNITDPEVLLRVNADLLRTKKDIDVSGIQKLGRGAMGTAFGLRDGRVLKVTADESEAISSFHLMKSGKNFKHVVKIFDVWKFKNSRWYGILQERLQKISETDADKLTDARGVAWPGILRDNQFTSWDVFSKKMIDDLAGHSNEQWEVIKAIEVLEKFSIDKMHNELRSIGIKFGDYHSGNIMKRGSDYVITDLGVSMSPGGQPPTLERLIYNSIKNLLKEEAEPDVDPESLPNNPEELGYNEDGFELEDRYEFQDLPISVEQEKGSTREWTDAQGNSGETKMAHDYGYIEGFKGADGDPVDVYVGPKDKSEWVYVIHQMKTPDFENFDEDKVMLGFDSEEDAKDAYLAHYNDDRFYGGMSAMKMDDFKKKLISSESQKITNENKSVLKYTMHEKRKALNSNKINLENIDYTLNEFKNKVLSKIPHKSIRLLGSAGKKNESGDIDLGIETTLSLDSVAKKINELGLRNIVHRGIGEISVEFPQFNKNGKINENVQVDLMFGPEKWTDFQYYSPSDTESKYKGVQVRALVGGLLNVLANHSVSPSRGIFDKGCNEKIYNQDPNYIAELLTKNSKSKWTINELKQPFEKIWKKTCESVTDSQLKEIKQYVENFMTSTKQTIPSEVSEVKKSKNIKHIDDLTEDKFWEFIEAIRSGNAEITEKLDGSAFMEFGISENGKIWAKSKNFGPVFESKNWPTGGALSTLQRVHAALESNTHTIRSNWPKGEQSVTCEILDGPVPNVLEYGPNAIVLHNRSEGFKKLAENVNIDGWIFECIPQVDIKLIQLEGKDSRNSIEESLMSNVKNTKPFFGGQFIEGFVIRNKKTNEMTKVVNKEMFTELNKCMWKHRALLSRGIKIEGKWFPGLTKTYRSRIANEVVGSKVVGSTGFVSYMKRNYGNLSLVEAIRKFAEDNDIFKKNYQDKFISIGDDCIEKFNALHNEWTTQPKPVFESNGFKVEMHSDIIRRTNEEFNAVAQWLKTDIATEDLSKFRILKTAMGRMKYFKLCEAFKQDPFKLREALGDDLFGGEDIPKDSPGSEPLTGKGQIASINPTNESEVRNLLSKNAKRLQKRIGIDPSKSPILGVGSQGTAFDIGGGKVLKVTKDSNEAIASKKIAGKRLRYVVQIFDVWKFKNVEVYGILQEKLTPLSDQEQNEFNKLLIHTGITSSIKRFDSWDDIVADSFSWVERKRAGGDVTSPEGKKAIQQANDAIDALESKYHMKDSWEELKSKGIKFTDYQAANLMKRGGSYVLIDIGLSEVIGGTEPDVLEKIMREIANNLFEDSRGSIRKILKLPAYVADYFHKVDSKHSFILAKSFLLWGLNTDYHFIDALIVGDEPDVSDKKNHSAWMDRLGKRIIWMEDWMSQFGNDLLKALVKNPNISKKIQNQESWHELQNFLETIIDVGEIKKDALMTFSDGFFWLDLKSSNCPAEAEKMGHCGTDWDGKLISLRDKNNNPHVTMTYNRSSNSIYQIKGKQNKPPESKYHQYIVDFFKKFNAKLKDEWLKKDSPELYKKIAISKQNRKHNEKDIQVDRNYWWLAIEALGGHLSYVFSNGSDDLNPATFHHDNDPGFGYGIDIDSKGYLDWVGLLDPDLDPDSTDSSKDLKPTDESLIVQYELLKVLIDKGILKGVNHFWKKRVPKISKYIEDNLPVEKIESIIYNETRKLFEKNADTVGVTIGRFQPFTAGHAKIIRDLATRYTKVVVLIAGNKKDKKNPFSFETRVEMMKESLLDVLPKLEVYKATWDGKDSGFVPGILSDISLDHKSSIKGDVAVNILVGSDRYDSMFKQVESAKRAWEKEKFETGLNPGLINVEKIARDPDSDDIDGVSGTKVRKAIEDNDMTTLSKSLDPHLVSNEIKFKEIIAKLKDEMNIKESLDEDLKDIGDENLLAVVKKNASRLSRREPFSINANNLKELGHGQKGIAFDMGSGKVFKVTTDEDEAKASNVIKNKKLNNVVRVFDVFRFKDDPLIPQDLALYGIVTEILTPLSEHEKAEVKRALAALGEEVHEGNLLDSISKKPWEQFVKQLYSDLEAGVVDELGMDPGSAAAQAKIKKITDRKYGFITSLMKKYNIPDMMKDLQAVGITFFDYSHNNIMKRGSQYIINDLGVSESSGQEPDVLEHIDEILYRTLESVVGSGVPGTSITMGGMGRHAATGPAQSSSWSKPDMMYTDDERESDPDAEPDDF